MKKLEGINFSVLKEDAQIIGRISKRAFALAKEHGFRYSGLDANMDVTACHANGCPLRLGALLQADNFNFAHDVFGIRQHLNRTTGQIEDCFLPRYAVPQNGGVR